MSADSPAAIIPFERFLECRERRRSIAATGTVVIPASTDLTLPPEKTGSANADHVESPRRIGTRLIDA